MNLDFKLQEHARNIPENLAIGSESSSYTYRELNEKVQNLADNFYLNSIRKGDRIAIILDNCPEFVVSYYACMRVGAISVPINPSLTPREFGVIINDSNPTIIIMNDTVNEKLSNTKFDGDPKLLITKSKEFDDLLTNGPIERLMNYSYPEECSILYTSGTTGLPKGAILTHYGLYHNAKVFAEAFNLNEEDRTLIVPPLSHIAAQSNCLNATMYSGGYNYMLPRWESSTKTLATMEDKEITFFFGPPTMYTYILNNQNISEFKLKLKYAYTGASALPEEIFNKWVKTFGFEIVEGYGLTECSPVVSTNPPHGRKKLGSVGLPIDGVSVKIVNEQFEEVPIGESGELVVRGPNVMKEYFNRLEENNNAFVDGWFKTGDIAKRDKDGYLYIVDRKKDVIIRSGFNVYPREVEEVLYQHPAVLEVAVIGYPDAERGELVKAVLTLKSGFSIESTTDLKGYCKERLASYKVPSTFEIVEELPKNASGKIVKGKLKEIFA
ncbi:class I adenylate-forming enzyme family protein [Oceanobacillus salinisoli]|uniref:class I adenylate-forming enzyme family protein n=1 Tax=Oceanobacillus salinisoli TaxID=2678611 RepID=UPI0012E17774|nr:AMP-binding protein [Oceanobacillus salinisoli]